MADRQRGQGVLNNPYLLMGVQLVLWGSYAAVSKLVLGSMAVWPFQCYSFGIAFAALAVPYFAKGGWSRLRKPGGKKPALPVRDCGAVLLYYFFTPLRSL